MTAAAHDPDDPVRPSRGYGLSGVWPEIARASVFVIALTLLTLSAGVAYAFFGTKWYRAEVLLAPQTDDSRSSLMGQFGGLASLAGISLGGSDDIEPLAVLKSREFAREFIRDEHLISVLLRDDWDAARKSWKGPKSRWPDERDAVKFFIEDVRQVVEDKKTGLVTVAVEWTDPVVAARWADLLVARLNSQMRARALAESETNVKYLRSEISSNNLVALQQSTARLLEMELQKQMLARGKLEYAFRIVDPAQVPKKAVRPQKLVVIPLAAVLGFFAATALVALRIQWRRATTSA